jgi:hypothetical protein
MFSKSDAPEGLFTLLLRLYKDTRGRLTTLRAADAFRLSVDTVYARRGMSDQSLFFFLSELYGVLSASRAGTKNAAVTFLSLSNAGCPVHMVRPLLLSLTGEERLVCTFKRFSARATALAQVVDLQPLVDLFVYQTHPPEPTLASFKRPSRAVMSTTATSTSSTASLTASVVLCPSSSSLSPALRMASSEVLRRPQGMYVSSPSSTSTRESDADDASDADENPASFATNSSAAAAVASPSTCTDGTQSPPPRPAADDSHVLPRQVALVIRSPFKPSYGTAAVSREPVAEAVTVAAAHTCTRTQRKTWELRVWAADCCASMCYWWRR